MACGSSSFFLLLEDGGYIEQEDARSRFLLELATTTGLFICGATIGPTAQLFPPAVTQVAGPPADRACLGPEALPLVLPQPTVALVARAADLTPPEPSLVVPPAVRSRVVHACPFPIDPSRAQPATSATPRLDRVPTPPAAEPPAPRAPRTPCRGGVLP